MGWPCNETLGIALLGVAGAERKKEVEEGTKQAAGWGGKVSIMPGCSNHRIYSDCRRIMLSRSGERPASSISAASCMRCFLVGLFWVLTAGNSVAAACRFRLLHRLQDS